MNVKMRVKKINTLRSQYEVLVHRLAERTLALADAQGVRNFAAHDQVKWSDCTVHIMVFVEPKNEEAR